jgi:hypothetical protein
MRRLRKLGVILVWAVLLLAGLTGCDLEGFSPMDLVDLESSKDVSAGCLVSGGVVLKCGGTSGEVADREPCERQHHLPLGGWDDLLGDGLLLGDGP